jgi:hypothetical protein
LTWIKRLVVIGPIEEKASNWLSREPAGGPSFASFIFANPLSALRKTGGRTIMIR